MEEKDAVKKALDFRKLKKENFVVLFLIGLLLLVIAWPPGNKKEERESSQSSILDTEGSIMGLSKKDAEDSSDEGEGPVTGQEELSAYRNSMERALEEVLASMEGAGKVKVMITLKTSGEAIVEKDFTTESSLSEEVDSQGGSRSQSQSGRSAETVYTSGSKGSSAPYVKQIVCPRIEGVVVCAQGGGNQSVNKNITEAIQALFGIEAHKIKVIKMSSK